MLVLIHNGKKGRRILVVLVNVAWAWRVVVICVASLLTSLRRLHCRCGMGVVLSSLTAVVVTRVVACRRWTWALGSLRDGGSWLRYLLWHLYVLFFNEWGGVVHLLWVVSAVVSWQERRER